MNKPLIRFEGFSEEWKQRELGELYSIYSGQTPFRGDIENFSNPTTAWIKTTDLNNATITSNEENISDRAKEKLKTLPMGTVLVAMYGGFNQIGRTGLLSYPAAINQAISALPPVNGIDSYFLMTELNHRVSEWKIVAASSRKDPNITKNDVMKFKLLYPSIEEQRKIGDFIRTLDATIATFIKEHEKTKSFKKAMLEAMFPKSGSKIPEIRFEGFDEEWEEKKLWAITDSFSGGTPSVNNDEYYNGRIPFIRSAEINFKETELFITESAINNSSAKLVNEGDILYALYGATSGEVGISQINGAINQAILALKPKCGYDSYFISQWLEKQKQTIVSTYLQGGQGNLSGFIVKNLIISLPKNKDEQIAIGNFFKTLDETISLQKKQIEQLQNVKKSLLEKMFV